MIGCGPIDWGSNPHGGTYKLRNRNSFMKEYSMISFLKTADLITLLHAITGFLAILYSIWGYFLGSVILILFSAFLDFIDGKVARLLGKETKFGKALDFADLISFGIAPAVLVLMIIPGFWTYLVASAFVASSLLRLARFNVTDTKFSIGMPTTFNGLIFPFIFFLDNYLKFNPMIYLAVMLVSSFLMLSSFKLQKL